MRRPMSRSNVQPAHDGGDDAGSPSARVARIVGARFQEAVQRAIAAAAPVHAGKPGAPDGGPHFPPKAKSVIWIFLCGGVSHVETFDVKPELNKYAGKSIEETPYKDVLDPQRVNANIIGANPEHGNRKVIMPLQTGFKKYGQSGLVVGDWFQHVGQCADDLAVVRSLY